MCKDMGTKGKDMGTLISKSSKYKVDEVPPTALWKQRINDLASFSCILNIHTLLLFTTRFYKTISSQPF